MFNEENVQGNCCYCGGIIDISEVACARCLIDMEKEAEYEDYLNRLTEEE